MERTCENTEKRFVNGVKFV